MQGNRILPLWLPVVVMVESWSEWLLAHELLRALLMLVALLVLRLVMRLVLLVNLLLELLVWQHAFLLSLCPLSKIERWILMLQASSRTPWRPR